MAISNTNSKVVYLCDGTTTEFPYPFKIFDKTHLKVIKYYIPSGEETELVLDTDYSVSGVGDDSGGTVTLLISPPDSNYKLIIMRNVPLTQEVDYRENDPFPAETLEQALDKLTMISQQLQEQVGRAVLQDPTQSQQVVIPTPVGGKYLYSPEDGKVEWTDSTSTTYPGLIARGNDADKPSSPNKGDVYYATDTGIMYVCYDSGTWTAYYSDVVRLSGDQTIHGIKKFMDKVGIGTDSPEVELDVDGYIFGAGKRRYAKTISVESDGDILLAYGARINGIWHLRFEGPDRVHFLSFSIAVCDYSVGNVKIHVIKHWCYAGQAVFGKPFVKYRTDGTVPHLYIPISNRNGGTTLDVVFEETAPFAATFMPSSTYNGETLDSTEYEPIGVWEPAGDDLYFGSYSKSTNGYTKLPNGLILQWGEISRGSSDAVIAVTFPITFPNAVLAVLISSDSIGSGTPDGRVSRTRDITVTGFVSVIDSFNSNRCSNYSEKWIAIGY